MARYGPACKLGSIIWSDFAHCFIKFEILFDQNRYCRFWFVLYHSLETTIKNLIPMHCNETFPRLAQVWLPVFVLSFIILVSVHPLSSSNSSSACLSLCPFVSLLSKSTGPKRESASRIWKKYFWIDKVRQN